MIPTKVTKTRIERINTKLTNDSNLGSPVTDSEQTKAL